ncbi:uncharacterized protein LOC127749166 [Frankliniella occidentalis]|uniref:Uncharacterized protein LOC127749166 n=1 Tax=Frankliniella occidentalis TaxID=133901 RepID=A0A9C6U5T8_FRAOC|nr:uncharacterized protein LOC127749166 [Frankliniella occidentalis]
MSTDNKEKVRRQRAVAKKAVRPDEEWPVAKHLQQHPGAEASRDLEDELASMETELGEMQLELAQVQKEREILEGQRRVLKAVAPTATRPDSNPTCTPAVRGGGEGDYLIQLQIVLVSMMMTC